MPRQNVRDAAAQPDKQPGAVTGKEVERRELRAMLHDMRPEFEKQLPRHIPPDYFMRVVLSGLQNSDQAAALAKCNRASLLAALLEAARYGLMPFTDEATIVPFGDTATFIAQYQGLVQMFYRTGQVAKVTAKLIHRNDEWAEGYGDGQGFYHKPRRFDANGEAVDRGPVILAYCYVTLKDGSRTEVEIVTRQEAIDVRDNRSKSWQRAESNGKRNSAWHTDFDAMWLKTAVRREAKWAPKSPELVELLMADAKADSADTPSRAGAPAAAWEADINYGTVVQGEVVHDEPETSAAPGMASQRTEAAAGTEAGPEPPAAATQEPGADGRASDTGVRAGTGGAAAAADPEAAGLEAERAAAPPDQATDIRNRDRIAAALTRRLERAGMAGKAGAENRLLALGALAAGDAAPLRLAAAEDLTLKQAREATDVLDRIQAIAGQDGSDLGAILAGIADGTARQLKDTD
jgi:phage RecT family recombinase